MIKNYIKIAWRNLINNKAHAFINIAGLSVGLACSLLVILWVQDERSVDSFHANGRLLYQIYEYQTIEGKAEATYLTQGLLADELKKQVPELQYTSGMEQNFPRTFEAGNKVVKLDGTYAGTDFFKMFSYRLLQGDSETALNALNGIAISRKMSVMFFGSPENAIGKTLRYENKDNLQVTAVFENIPANSSQQFDFLRSWKSFVAENAWVNNWNSTSPATFVQLRADADPVKVADKIKGVINQYSPGVNIKLALQPYTEKYLHSNFKNGRIDGGRIEYVQLFSIIAVFIMLLACINFMNMATARSIKRAREVGVRKVIGAQRLSLITQFISEAMLLSFISLMVALVMVIIALPAFSSLTAKQLFIPVEQPSFWIILSCMLAITSFVAGSYPAFFLSSLNPVRVLKGSLTFSSGAKFFRKGLVVFQFTLAIIFIVGSIVIYRQVKYIQTKNIGYNRENLLYIPLEGDLLTKYPLFKDEAARIPGIRSVSTIKESPTEISHKSGNIRWIGKDPTQNIGTSDTKVSYDFVKTLQLELKDGRDFSKEFADSANFLLNEAAVKRIGYKNPVGMPLWWGDNKGKIVGVIKDFHFTTMYSTIEPIFIRLDNNLKWGNIIVRIQSGKTQEAIISLEQICKRLNPNFTFSYKFSDQEYAKLYHSEQVVSKLATYFTFLSIFISCLGLLGLAMFMTEQRYKEIGIRKVLGANVNSLFVLLSSDLLLLIIIAFVISIPLAWLTVNKWLQGFAYRIVIHWGVFALTGCLIVFIAILTIGFQVIKAVLANPVKSLRGE